VGVGVLFDVGFGVLFDVVVFGLVFGVCGFVLYVLISIVVDSSESSDSFVVVVVYWDGFIGLILCCLGGVGVCW